MYRHALPIAMYVRHAISHIRYIFCHQPYTGMPCQEPHRYALLPGIYMHALPRAMYVCLVASHVQVCLANSHICMACHQSYKIYFVTSHIQVYLAKSRVCMPCHQPYIGIPRQEPCWYAWSPVIQIFCHKPCTGMPCQ